MRVQTLLRAAAIICLGSIAFSASSLAATIGITYSNVGALTTDPVFDGTFLTLDALANGSFFSGDPHFDATWNPASFHTHDMLDVTTGLDTGVFTITFATGDTLFGNLFEVDSQELLETNLGSFTQTLVFTGGTGTLAGASGSTMGGGIVGPETFTASGTGTLTAAGITPVPEPASIQLIAEGLLVSATACKLTRRRLRRQLPRLDQAKGRRA